MANVSHNHANYQARLDFIRQGILVKHFGLSGKDVEQTQIVPIAYDPECPFKYNNFVYHITVPASSDGPNHQPILSSSKLQPGCTVIPDGTHDFILRLSNHDAEGMHQATRIENEVAILGLVAVALRYFEPAVVPRVFAWSGAGTSQGWILQERMSGTPVDTAFPNMGPDQKRHILAQTAAILKGLQDYKLPETIAGWGGVTFDVDGRVVSGPMASVGAGPWPSFEASYQGRLQAALQKCDANPHLAGWRENGVRERLDAFVERGLPAKFAMLTSKDNKTVVHGDFTTNNLLYDPETGRLTALLDYDFASVLHPCYEFLRSFDGSTGQFRGWSGSDTGDDEALRKAKLSGRFPSPLPANTEDVSWDTAKMWEDELQKLQLNRPSTMEGIDKVADVDAILRAILPWHVCNSDFLNMQGEGAAAYFRSIGEKKLVRLLEHSGF